MLGFLLNAVDCLPCTRFNWKHVGRLLHYMRITTIDIKDMNITTKVLPISYRMTGSIIIPPRLTITDVFWLVCFGQTIKMISAMTFTVGVL